MLPKYYTLTSKSRYRCYNPQILYVKHQHLDTGVMLPKYYTLNVKIKIPEFL